MIPAMKFEDRKRAQRCGGTTPHPTRAQPPVSMAHRTQYRCACGGSCPRCGDALPIQTKVAAGDAADACEQEAERVADQVLSMPNPSIPPSPVEPVTLHGSRISVGRKKTGNTQERKHNALEGSSLTTPQTSVQPVGAGNRLDPQTRTYFERRFGYDFGHVRVRTDDAAAASARAVNARAFANRATLVFGKGEYSPNSSQGRRLIAHELAHVIQQSDAAPRDVAGREKPGCHPLVRHQLTPGSIQRAPLPCGIGMEGSIRDALDRAEVLRNGTIAGLNGLVEHMKRSFQTGVISPASGFLLVMRLLQRHFNFAERLSGKVIPTSGAEIAMDDVLKTRDSLLEIIRLLGLLNFDVALKCDADCGDADMGGRTVPGSGTVVICDHAFDCQMADGKLIIAYHEAIHGSDERFAGDVYRSDDSYPPEYERALKNADSLANFSYEFVNRGVANFEMCWAAEAGIVGDQDLNRRERRRLDRQLRKEEKEER